MSNKKRRKQQPAVKVDMEVNSDVDMENMSVNMNEVTDSEDEYTPRERKLLQKVRTRKSSENYDSEDEVYKLKDEDESEEQEDEDGADSMESDIEGMQEDADLPNERAWGKKKRVYYSTDYVDPDYASVNQKDLAEAEIEEQEARNIQKRLAEQMDDADFGLEFIQVQKEKDKEEKQVNEEVVKTDLSKLSKRQKQAMMQKESPEFAALVNDFKERMTEAKDVLAPYLKLMENRALPDCRATLFVKTKYQLLLNYCINISFYLMLKAKRLPISSHPVIKRLAQYRQLLNQLESGQGNLINEIKDVLNAEREGKPLYHVSDGLELGRSKDTDRITRKRLRKKEEKLKQKVVEEEEEEAEEEEMEAEKSSSARVQSSEDDLAEEGSEEEDEEEREKIWESEEPEETAVDEVENSEDHRLADSEGKRAITYEMAKNRGLTPYRKKELRNPRVKHRNKYRKAKIRRKGAVREVRKEVTRYAGEISGIKASVKKSIKLK